MSERYDIASDVSEELAERIRESATARVTPELSNASRLEGKVRAFLSNAGYEVDCKVFRLGQSSLLCIYSTRSDLFAELVESRRECRAALQLLINRLVTSDNATSTATESRHVDAIRDALVSCSSPGQPVRHKIESEEFGEAVGKPKVRADVEVGEVAVSSSLCGVDNQRNSLRILPCEKGAVQDCAIDLSGLSPTEIDELKYRLLPISSMRLSLPLRFSSKGKATVPGAELLSQLRANQIDLLRSDFSTTQ